MTSDRPVVPDIDIEADIIFMYSVRQTDKVDGNGDGYCYRSTVFSPSA